MTINLADSYEAIADVIGERPALVIDDVRWTYAELDAQANRVGHFLEGLGVRPNEHLAMHLRNSPEFVATLIGALKVRAVPVNINFRYTASELEYLYSNSDSTVLFVDPEFCPVVAEVLPRLTVMRDVVVVGDEVPEDFRAACEAAGITAHSYHPEVDRCDDSRGFAERSPDDHFMVYTGGTTGHPKGVIWRHEDFYYAALSGGNPYGDPHESVAALAEAAAASGGMTLLIPAPLIHGAAVYAVFSMFFTGSKLVVMRNWDAREALRLIAAEQVQIIMVVGDAMGVPFVDELVENWDSHDVSTLFAINNGGAIWSQASRDKLKTVMPDIFIRDNFGASESGTDGQLEMTEAGELRMPPSPRSAVVDEALEPIGPGERRIGYLARIGHVPLEYYKDPEKTAATFPVRADGVRMSVLGDMARVEDDGTIVLLGRGSGCINTGGEKVFPEEVEQALKSHPAIFDALVAGAPDPKFGESVSAVIQLRDGFDEPSLEEIVTHCRTRIAGYKCPRSVVVVPEIRRSPAGKADYRWAKRTVSPES